MIWYNLEIIYTKELQMRRTEGREFLRADALEKAKQVTLFLKERYKAEKVILFGSVYSKRFFHKKSGCI